MHESTSLRDALEAAGVVPVAGAASSAAEVAAAWARIVESAAAEVGAASSAPEDWTEPQRAVVVDAVDRTARVLEAAKAPILVAQERAGVWRRPGIRSFEAFRAAKNREDAGAARREADAARTLTELEGGLKALARGEITPSHARQLRPVTDKMDPAARAELLSGEGASMVRELAKEHDPKVFGRKVEELAARRHPAEVQDAHEAIRARRFLRIYPGPAGTRIEGLLDAVAGHRLQLAIEAASPRPAEDDTRTLGQRNADALDAISGSVLAEGGLAPSRHVPTQVMITMTEQTFLAAQTHLAGGTHATPRHSCGAGRGRDHVGEDRGAARGGGDRGQNEDGWLFALGPGHSPASGAAHGDDPAADGAPCEGCADSSREAPAFPAVRTQDGPLLPPADLGRLLCGSAVGRMVVDAESVPLNVGRSQRTFKNYQRRAVEVRDQHCAWPGCGQVARYCEVHHLDHWVADHGETDVNRGVLVCSFHHHELHRHDLDLVATPAPEPPSAVRPLPGDSDYVPPVYELAPRVRTADERRARRRERLPRGVGQKAAARRKTPPGRPPGTARGNGAARTGARRQEVDDNFLQGNS